MVEELIVEDGDCKGVITQTERFILQKQLLLQQEPIYAAKLLLVN